MSEMFVTEYSNRPELLFIDSNECPENDDKTDFVITCPDSDLFF